MRVKVLPMIQMKIMGGPKYNSGDLNQDIKQIGQDSFTYYVTLIKPIMLVIGYCFISNIRGAHKNHNICIALNLNTKTETNKLPAVDDRVRGGII